MAAWSEVSREVVAASALRRYEIGKAALAISWNLAMAMAESGWIRRKRAVQSGATPRFPVTGCLPPTSGGQMRCQMS
ncbi:hypothetical protein Fraau_3171 [Frateuria aurantia DSM 6220]|uniref:Uncharacterized protein n=1 Tax=Frateuria aurantia (strain ATCC 33424 / DSM 6220 / KCTC 2777 / LMG 1558 / NBRC 3245 / NCIMB 13370) TaxID=767434 RepID=H8L187_FRAAD|nr:hypothetical protein Fraau_3171 [Frateuria aurantia DSM 6220]